MMSTLQKFSGETLEKNSGNIRPKPQSGHGERRLHTPGYAGRQQRQPQSVWSFGVPEEDIIGSPVAFPRKE
jgi:hypothetical protein